MLLNMEVPLLSERFKLIGIKKIFLAPAKRLDLMRPGGPTRALFGLLPRTSAKDTGHNLADFLKSVQLFESKCLHDLVPDEERCRTLARLATA